LEETVTNDPTEERIREVIIGEIEPQIIVRPPPVALSRESRPPGVAHGELDEALDPLVSTKLRPSQARPKLVARPRLVGRLDPEAGRRLTLVSAPAGFGKTTLLGKWAKDQMDKGRPVAWLSLDEDDNDPARFVAYLVAAISRGTGEEGFGEGVLAALRSPEPPRLEALAGALVNEVASLPGGLDLVLDDYHVIDSEGVHRIVTTLLGHLPENAHLLISSRVDPPLPLARLHARDQMAKLGASELAFTREEAVAFLKGVMDLDLSSDDVATLEGRTEGWITGLQLAALSMRGRDDVPDFVESFSGSHRDVLDFLAEEVLERQPEHVREFLLETSILDRLTGPLCDALIGRAYGQAMLEGLERENLFVVALDEERRWYRYHHLFRDFLRGRLMRERPESAGELHLRASGWYEQSGNLAEAIGHALSAPDYDLAARLIEEDVEGAVERGEGTTALRWLEALPTEAKRLRPRLFVEHAVALVITGRPDDAEPLLKEAERAAEVGGEEGQFLLGFASAVRSWCARLRGDAPEAVELARRALSLLPDEEAPHRNYAAVRLGDALRAVGDLTAADEAYAEAAEIDRAARHAYVRLAGMVMHARVRAEQGRLREADEAFQSALHLLTEAGFELSPAAGVLHIGRGALLYERNDLDGAERALERGVELAERTGDVSTLVWAYVTLSRNKRARGDEEGALEKARQAERVARDSRADLQIAIALAWMTRLHLARGDLVEAVALEQERAANAENAADAARVVDRLTSARLLYAQGRHREALALLEELGETAEAAGRTGDVIEILALQALALWAGGKKERAVSTLARALALAAPEGYVRTFVDEGAVMGDLLSATLEARQKGRTDSLRRVPAHYLRKLLTALERDAADAASSAAGLPEPLSERELEVLRLIASGKSNREISSELFVSVGTVKTHIINLYRKLDAHSRTQALARARELNLL
jgi:LuxR family transcriptional regulator, maltose regulon positive regulatory protein